MEAGVLRARALLARKEFAAARVILHKVIEQYPREVWPRVILSHVWLQEGLDPVAAEKALRDVLELAPCHLEAHRNLSVLLLQQQPNALPSRAVRYHQACSIPSDLNEHLPTLLRLARECRQVTLLGVDSLRAPLALLHGQPERLVCVSWNGVGVEELQALAGRTTLVQQQVTDLEFILEETDLLVVDMLHDYELLRKVLAVHGSRVQRWLVVHDTTTFREHGETPGRKGLWPAIEELLATKTFQLVRREENNNGLTLLERW
jgi:hypothetical protein